MSVGDLFGDALWRGVGEDLRGESLRWWEKHRDTIVGLTRDEMQDLANSLKAGSTFNGKMAVVAHMSPEEFRAWEQKALARLQGIAARRAAMLDALEDLGLRAAKTIGTAILGALL